MIDDGENKTPFQKMIDSGNFIPTTGPLDRKVVNPLKALSCEEVSRYLPDFCNAKLGNELILRKMAKHLKESVSKRCGCAERLVELKEKLDGGNQAKECCK